LFSSGSLIFVWFHIQGFQNGVEDLALQGSTQKSINAFRIFVQEADFLFLVLVDEVVQSRAKIAADNIIVVVF
jgi:hypothetical protein